MSLPLDPLLDRITPLLAQAGRPVHLVGGVVRDALLGRPNHDIDLIVPGDAIGLTKKLAEQLAQPWFPMDEGRDVGRIFVGETGMTVDISRYRGETLADDLRGRDFTINALALPLGAVTAAEVIDHHGGRDDLANRVLRVIHAGSIADDPVRALRAARFTVQLGFELTGNTLADVRAAAGLFPDRTSPERIRDELSRLLLLNEPQKAIGRLDNWGLLDRVLPEVAALRGLEQSPPHHEAVLPHTLSVLRYLAQVEQLVDGRGAEAAWAAAAAAVLEPHRAKLSEHLEEGLVGGFSGRLLLRWSALFHDTGKATTRTVDETGRVRFLGHDDAGAILAGVKLNRLKFSSDAVRRVRDTVAGHMRPLHLANEDHVPSRRSLYRYYRALDAAGVDVALLSLADHLATHEGPGENGSWEKLLAVVGILLETYYNEREQTVKPARLLDGQAIMKLLDIGPGRELGQLIAQLEEAQAAGEVSTRDQAAAFLINQQARP